MEKIEMNEVTRELPTDEFRGNWYEHVTELINMLGSKDDNASIRCRLQSLDKNIKGKVFEHFLAKIYEGNGWVIKIVGGRGDNGADILLYQRDDLENPVFIVQAKNHGKPLTVDATRSELIKFEQDGAPKYGCEQFILVTINGFAKEAERFEKYNLRLEDWSCVEKLLKSYDPAGKKPPTIELAARNLLAYRNIEKLISQNNKACAV